MPKPTPPQQPNFLAIDTGSSQVTVAVGNSHRREVASLAIGESSSGLLDSIDTLLKRSGTALSALDGLLCTAGPGSFTGLRIGLATMLGLHESSRIPAVALPSLWVQAAAYSGANSTSDTTSDAGAETGSETIVSLLTAHRGQVYTQTFTGIGLRSLGPISTTEDPTAVINLDATLVSSEASVASREDLGTLRINDPGPLALCLLQLAATSPPSAPSLFAWDTRTLTRPLYAHTPAVSARPKAVRTHR